MNIASWVSDSAEYQLENDRVSLYRLALGALLRKTPALPKVLIAEDDFMIADMTESILIEHGYDVCGIGRTVSEAVELGLRHKPDLAIIDLRLANGDCGTDIAPQLMGLRRLGVLYASGNVSSHSLLSAIGDGCLAKPFGPTDLLQSLRIVSEIVATGFTLSPFPRGFHLLREGCLFRASAA